MVFGIDESVLLIEVSLINVLKEGYIDVSRYSNDVKFYVVMAPDNQGLDSEVSED